MPGRTRWNAAWYSLVSVVAVFRIRMLPFRGSTASPLILKCSVIVTVAVGRTATALPGREVIVTFW